MRVGIVNDLPIAVEAIRRVLAGSRELEVAWTARDGAEAVAMCASDTPDIVLMDLLMPVMNGVEATRQIMARFPCAILVVTANADDNCAQVFDAMAAGALDVVNTPVIGGHEAGGGEALLAKLRTIASLVSSGREPVPRKSRPTQDAVAGNEPLVVMGASAGGPTALAAILSRLPAGFPAGIVIVQHVDAQFVPGMAGWLSDHSGVPIRVAESGDRPQPGTALLAAGGAHLVFASATALEYSPATQHDLAYCPSVDIFFESVARHRTGRVAGVLLSGMGRDGAAGLKLLRNAGCRTFVQDRESSVVYGMPKAAVQLDAADEILPADRIAGALVRQFATSVKSLK